MKKSVSRSFLKVLSVTAAAAAILTLTGCVEEPASTSPANINISISNSNNSTSTSTASSSSASSKTEQEATSTSQNPELPASSSSEASSPASSTPASEPEKPIKTSIGFGNEAEIEGGTIGYYGLYAVDVSKIPGYENKQLLIMNLAIDNTSGSKTIDLINSIKNDALMPEDAAGIAALFENNRQSAKCVAFSGTTAVQAVCYGLETNKAAVGEGADAFVYLLAPEDWQPIELKFKPYDGAETLTFKILPVDINRSESY